MRKPWDEYFMNIVDVVATRSTCCRRKVGAITVKDKRILTTGYNGSPSGLDHCSDVGCMRDNLKISSGTQHESCMAIHAEQNAIIQAASYGISLQGATMYISCQPCVICSKMIVNTKIDTIIYEGNYPDELALSILDKAGIRRIQK